MPDTTATGLDEVAALLRAQYGLAAADLARLDMGQGTVNYRAAVPGHNDVFVKCYPPGTNLDAELEAITLTSLAARHGVPVAPLIPAAGGQAIAANGPTAISAWQWMPGSAATNGLTAGQAEQAGSALGRIHSAFAQLPASSGPAPQTTRWREDMDVAGLRATIGQLRVIIARRAAGGQASEFDAIADQTLAERDRDLDCVPGLLASLPGLSSQVLHGDFAPVNLLFDDGRLIAVLDFRPPDPFLIAYDLGRVAFFPTTIARGPGWPEAAHALVAAYLDSNPAVCAADVRACARVALLQLVTSLYGVKQHYLKPGLIQDDIDRFWLQRHAAVAILLDCLAEADDLLADLAGRLPSSTAGSR
jgi:Ser/Thr protein kinase RdoA (MazF antagonist)